jgi:hypothetical protein
MKSLWKITGSQREKTFTVTVRAADYNEAVRLGSTTHMLVVKDVVLIESMKVTFRNSGKKAHPGLLMPPLPHEKNRRLVAACECPGSRNGSLTKGATIITYGWEKSNCKS